jgi:serralysin
MTNPAGPFAGLAARWAVALFPHRALLSGHRWRVRRLSYGFADVGFDFSWRSDWTEGFLPLPEGGRAAFRRAYARWAAACGLELVEADALLRVFVTEAELGANEGEGWPRVGYGYYPGDLPGSGDIWLTPEVLRHGWEDGGFSLFTAVHEIGHALGLKHPHEDTPAMPPAFDCWSWTVMSRRPGAGSAVRGTPRDLPSYPAEPAPLDVKAVRLLYGAPPPARGPAAADRLPPPHQWEACPAGTPTVRDLPASVTPRRSRQGRCAAGWRA